MAGHEMPTPKVARAFLYAFHDEERIEAAQQEPLRVARRAAELMEWAEAWRLLRLPTRPFHPAVLSSALPKGPISVHGRSTPV